MKPAAFAALVPNSAEKVLGEVIEEIMGDHEMLVSSDLYKHHSNYFIFPALSQVLPYACRQERIPNKRNLK